MENRCSFRHVKPGDLVVEETPDIYLSHGTKIAPRTQNGGEDTAKFFNWIMIFF